MRIGRILVLFFLPMATQLCSMKEVTIGSWCNQMNVGYIRQLKLIATSDILRFDEPYSFDNLLHQFSYEGLELKEDATVYSIDFYRRECSFSESSAIDVSGIIYDFNIDWTWICQRGELLDFLHRNRYKQWVAFFTDQNGKSYVVGSLELPMTLLFGRSIQQSNFIKIRLNAKSWHPAWFIENINLLEMLTTSIIDLRRYANRDIIVYEGDTIQELFVFRDANSNIENLTGSTFKLQVRRVDGSIVTTFTMNDGFSLQNSNNELLMQKTDVIPAGEYLYDLQRTYPDSIIETQMKGKFIVESQITT